MSRYEKVFTLTPMLYVQGSPVIIEAGALYKDNKSTCVVAQLKFKSISVKQIKALTIKIMPLDTIGNNLGNSIEYQYLDLSIKRDDVFGSKNAITLPNNTTRAIKVFITNVVFNDNTNVFINEQEWTSIPNQEELNLDDIETEFFYSSFNAYSKKQAIEYSDLWLCHCGAINHNNEDKCHFCNCSFNTLNNIDFKELHNEAYYQFANNLISTDNIASLKKANAILEKNIDYKNSKSLIEENISQIKLLEKKANITKKKSIIVATSIFIAIVIAIVSSVVYKNVIVPKKKLSQAIVLAEAGNYETANSFLNDIDKEKIYETANTMFLEKKYEVSIYLFEKTDGYNDSTDKLKECKYSLANAYFNKKDYSTAYNFYKELENYKDSKEKLQECSYQTALVYIKNKEYYDASILLNNLNDYKDSKNILKDCEKQSIKNADVGLNVVLGRYAQSPIAWRVLDKKGDRLLIITERVLSDGIKYYKTKDPAKDTTWEKSSIRKYVNGDFLNSAFNRDEKKLILTTKVRTQDNYRENWEGYKWKTDGGNDTKDKLFFLSINEANKYFKSDQDRKATEFITSSESSWWLRSPGENQSDAAFVYNDGGVVEIGVGITCTTVGFRPAMWIKLC